MSWQGFNSLSAGFISLLASVSSAALHFLQPLWLQHDNICLLSKTMSRVRASLRLRSVTRRRNTDFISTDKESVCFFSPAKSGPRRPPPHWACDRPRGPDPASSQFSCAFVGSFPLISWPSCMASFFPPSCPSPSLLYLLDPCLETLTSPRRCFPGSSHAALGYLSP